MSADPASIRRWGGPSPFVMFEAEPPVMEPLEARRRLLEYHGATVERDLRRYTALLARGRESLRRRLSVVELDALRTATEELALPPEHLDGLIAALEALDTRARSGKQFSQAEIDGLCRKLRQFDALTLASLIDALERARNRHEKGNEEGSTWLAEFKPVDGG